MDGDSELTVCFCPMQADSSVYSSLFSSNSSIGIPTVAVAVGLTELTDALVSMTPPEPV